MDIEMIDAVMFHANKGHTIKIGQSPTGQMKIKIKYGPLGLLTARFSPDMETYQAIRSKLRRR